VIVVDASAAIGGLLRDGPARDRLASDALHAPHVLDVEVVDVVRKLVLRGALGPEDGVRALATWQRLGVSRYAAAGMLERMWELRHNVSAYDAAYIALAEALGCHLLTADRRLAAADGPRCTIELVPR
jgi:predicted nucleic acid-binding protein